MWYCVLGRVLLGTPCGRERCPYTVHVSLHEDSAALRAPEGCASKQRVPGAAKYISGSSSWVVPLVSAIMTRVRQVLWDWEQMLLVASFCHHLFALISTPFHQVRATLCRGPDGIPLTLGFVSHQGLQSLGPAAVYLQVSLICRKMSFACCLQAASFSAFFCKLVHSFLGAAFPLLYLTGNSECLDAEGTLPCLQKNWGFFGHTNRLL